MAKYVDYDGLGHFYDNIADRPVQAFDTVAEMQAATYLEAGMVCHTNGFHTSGDGGAAYYTVSASGTANGMDVLALQGGLFATLVVTEPYVSPLMLGARADGTTDDMAAFSRAISLLDEGQRLYAPSGDYLLGQTLTISKNIDFECDGRILVTHAAPVIVLDGLKSVNVNIDTIKKSARVYDYIEGATDYSIGVIVKNCESCIVNVDTIANVTTGVVLLSDNGGCYYNTISCNEAYTFTGIELIRASTGDAVNGNNIDHFTWLVNTWVDNTGLVPSYMIKSLSNAKSGESEPYRNNGNTFNGLIAEYGAKVADYPILLARLDYARGYTLCFDRVEILVKTATLQANMLYFTNSTYCTANVLFSHNDVLVYSNVDNSAHNFVYIKTDYESLKRTGVVDIIDSVTFHESVSYTKYWFNVVKLPAIKTVKILGELIVNADIPNGTELISGLPKGRSGHGVMKIQMGTTATLWNSPTNVTFYKLNCGGQNATVLANRGVIPSGTRLYVDIEYLIDDSAL